VSAPPDLGDSLLRIARGAIGEAFGIALRTPPATPGLAAVGATFVTLRLAGDLRGCIGTVEPFRALDEDVRANALAAAFRDPRFAPLARDEFAAILIEVSVLGPRAAIAARDEDAALAQLRPEVDGVVLEAGARRATFLPQVWEQLPDPRDFLAALKRKAGLPATYWDDSMRLSRYSVEKFMEARMQ
jgi:AmmeMemoRadiSam system protein A